MSGHFGTDADVSNRHFAVGAEVSIKFSVTLAIFATDSENNVEPIVNFLRGYNLHAANYIQIV